MKAISISSWAVGSYKKNVWKTEDIMDEQWHEENIMLNKESPSIWIIIYNGQARHLRN